jgi:cell division protein FtsQ
MNATRSKANNAKAKGSSNPLSKSSQKSAPKSAPKSALKRESKRLLNIRKSEKRKGLFSRVSPEVKRFTAASRKRRIVLAISAASIGSLFLLVLATIFTPLLAVEKIEVGGIKRLKEKSIVNALTSQLGKPLPTVSAADVATSLKAFPLIESFSIISLPPHTLKIQIAERQPIGVITVSGTNYLYDPAGVRIGIATGSEKLPTIQITGLPEKSTQFRAAIEVLMALPADLLSRVSEINANSKDDVTLRLRGYSGQRIIWGDGSDSVLKSRVLDALIANQKKTDRVTFDVSSPNAPVVRYGNF